MTKKIATTTWRITQVTRNPLLGRNNTTYPESLSAYQDCCESWHVRVQPTNRQSEAISVLCFQQPSVAAVVQRLAPGGRGDHFTELFPIFTKDLALAQSKHDG